MKRLLVPFLLALTLLAACASQTADGGLQTATPPPTVTPTRTLTPTATFTPTPLPHPSAFDPAFARGLVRFDPAGGEWLVTASYRTADGGLQTADFAIDPDSFDTHDALRQHNPLAPYTVRATDPDGRPVTLIWNPDTAEFRVAASLPAIYDGVNTDHPTFNPEAYANIPHYTIEDIQSGFALQSLLVSIQDRLDNGETLEQILYINPEATRSNWQNLGGNSLLFRLQPDGRYVLLKAKGNDQSAQTLRYDNMTMKILPFGAQVEVNGQDYFAFYIANFDPLDPQNPDPTDLANWKFFLTIPTYAGEYISIQSAGINWTETLSRNPTIFPLVTLYGDPEYQQNHPLLAQLLAIEGNDPHNLPNDDGHGIDFANISGNLGYLNMLDEDNLILETQAMRYPIAPHIQQMLFLIEVGT
ncbi:MAG: hypothetical protein ABWK53_08215, partial [Anaerolineales bacterium]